MVFVLTAFVIMAALINRLAKKSIGLVRDNHVHQIDQNTNHPFVIAAVATMTKRKNNEFGGSSLTFKWLTWGLVFLSLLIFASTTHAQLTQHPLSASEIRSHLYAHTMAGEYPSGQRWAERFNADGTSKYSHRGQISSGLMTLNGNILCFTYDDSDVGGCFEVWKHGPNCFSFYSSGSSATLDQRQLGRAWDARGWYVGQQPTCAGDQIS